MTLSNAPIVLVFGVVAVLFVIGIQAANPWSAKVWSRPSWSENPFSMRQPCQFFHFGAWHTMAWPVAGALTETVLRRPLHPEYVVIAAFGVGLRIGVSLVEIVFRPKFTGGLDPSAGGQKQGRRQARS
jgi:hypothetical protein